MRKFLTLGIICLLPLSSVAQETASTYVGELVLNQNTTLPLQLNIDGDATTLDSPAQGAYGIAVNEIALTVKRLSFSSNVIQASFEGERTDSGCYQGHFTQGVSYPLTLCPAQNTVQKTPEQQLAELPAEGAVIQFDDGRWTIEHLTYNIEAGKLFEIGSVTKTMVAWLLATALHEGVVTEDTRLKQYWPQANQHVGNIRLVDIATHHSGLSRLPQNLSPKNINDPYVNFGIGDLTQAVAESSVTLPATYQYSNFGYGLLAETLAKAYDTSFKQLMQTKVFEPLGMSDSYLALETIDKPRLIAGSRIDGTQVPHWHFDALAGAGAVVSTVADMVRYLKSLMQPSQSLKPIVDRLLAERERLDETSHQALGWIKQLRDQHIIIWHNGQTAGFASFVGFTANGKRGVVILTNRARSVTAVGKALLSD